MTELDCKQLVDTITDYLEGTMPPEDRARFEVHLGECTYCANYLDQMRATIATLGKIGEQSIPPEGKDELLRVFRDYRRTGE